MKKTFLCFLCLFFLNSISAFAADSKMVFTDLNYYNAKIYVCDTKNSQAILLGVIPANNIPNPMVTTEIEYRAIPIASQRIYGSKGQKLSMGVVNGYLLDSQVRVLIGKNAYGYKILYMQFLK